MHFNLIFLALYIIIPHLEIVHSNDLYSRLRHRKRRSLIYPPTSPTRLQYIAGIGIPVEDLTYESVTSGYVLKAEYFLPITSGSVRPQYIKPQNVARRSLQVNDYYNNNNNTFAYAYDFDDEDGNEQAINDQKRRSASFDVNLSSKQRTAAKYRWIIYKSMEMLMNRKGVPGRDCMLRSICEHAAVPLHYEGGLLAEILHIILTPSRSLDEFDQPSNIDYGRAERIGHKGGDCAATYAACKYSPIDQITTVVDVDGIFDA